MSTGSSALSCLRMVNFPVPGKPFRTSTLPPKDCSDGIAAAIATFKVRRESLYSFDCGRCAVHGWAHVKYINA